MMMMTSISKNRIFPL